MTNPHVLDRYDEADFGRDLLHQPGGDWVLANGDLETQTGRPLALESRIRELTTPLGYLARYIRDVQGVKVLDADYGNRLYNVLSEPVNRLPAGEMARECERIMLKDGRFTQVSAKPQIDAEKGRFYIEINYSFQDGPTGSIDFTLPQRGS